MNPYRTTTLQIKPRPASLWRRLGGWWRGTYKKMVLRKERNRARPIWGDAGVSSSEMDGFISALLEAHDMNKDDVTIRTVGRKDAFMITRKPGPGRKYLG